jgi:hypothetical protein
LRFRSATAIQRWQPAPPAYHHERKPHDDKADRNASQDFEQAPHRSHPFSKASAILNKKMRLQVYGCNHVATEVDDLVKAVDLHNQRSFGSGRIGKWRRPAALANARNNSKHQVP